MGALFYAEPRDPMVLLGAALIFTRTWFSLARESHRVALTPARGED